MTLPQSEKEQLVQNLKITGQQYFDMADKLLEEIAVEEKEYE